MAELKETVNMKKEILAVGTWNRSKITEALMDEMIRNFDELKDRKPVPLRVGHETDDKPSTKILAAGWIHKLERVGDKLVAHIKDVPTQIAEFIKEELLKPVSIEFWKEWKDGGTGKVYKNLLTAVALMGAAAPAVAGLEDFDISFSDDNADVIKIEYQEENDMDLKELQEENARLKAERVVFEKEAEKTVEFADELKKKDEEIKKKDQELTKANANLKIEQEKAVEFAEKQATQAIEEFIELNSSEKSMKILPAEKERVGRILKALDNEIICFEEKDVKMNVREEFQAFVEGFGQRVEFDTKTGKGKIEKTVEFADENEKNEYVIKKANELVKEKKISFGDASIEVIEALEKKEA